MGRQLSGMAVTNSNGSAYDLSSNFKPDRADYGAMLPPEATSATLCLQPEEGMHPICLQALSELALPYRMHCCICTLRLMLGGFIQKNTYKTLKGIRYGRDLLLYTGRPGTAGKAPLGA